MHNRFNAPRRLRAGAAAVPLALVCLALAACGGSSSAPSTSSAPSIHVTTPSPAPGQTGAAPASGLHSAIVRACSAKAGTDFATLEICMASHGVSVQSSPALLNCLHSAAGSAGIAGCLIKYAQ